MTSANGRKRSQTSKKLNARRASLRSNNHSKRIQKMLIAGVIIAVLVMIYPSLRDYYVAARTQEDLETYQAQLEDSNGQLKSDISYLETTDGIEDEARKRGYVGNGETGVEVNGLDDSSSTDNTTNSSDSSASNQSTDTSSSLPWYKRILDEIFNYVSEVQ